MATLAECPICHKKQSVKNRRCSCGEDLVKAKRSKRVRFWIDYLVPGGKPRREAVGYSIEEARDADGKRRGQKRENRIFDIKPEVKMTFQEMANWFLDLESVKAKRYHPTLTINLSSFLAEFGNVIVSQIKPADLENYQAKRKAAGYSESYIDQEVGAARTMIYKAFDNDLVGGDTLKAFKKVKKMLKRNGNARDRVLSYEEYERLIAALPEHARAIVEMGLWTGMRRGEIVSLRWEQVDLENRMIRLGAGDTKEGKAKTIPISNKLLAVLMALPNRLRASDTDHHVFQYRGQSINGDIRSSLERACREAKIPYGRNTKDGFTFHDLRHSFITFARKADVARNVVMAITGHVANDMNFRYDTVDESDLLKAVDQIEAYFANLDQNLDQEASDNKKEASQNKLTSRNN
jgi:integrase